MRVLLSLSVLAALAHAESMRPSVPARVQPAAPTAEVALEWLRFGNERHVSGKYVHWHQSPERRREVARGERPHSIILSCSDSRVPPEIVFDQGLGDLFVVRVAGNVVGEKETGSIEYAAVKLEAPLIVVLGHDDCPMVDAALRAGSAPGHINSLLASMSAAIARSRSMPGDPLANAIQSNIDEAVRQLRQSEPVIAQLVAERRVKIIGAKYDLMTGAVQWSGDEPARSSAQQGRLGALSHE